MKRFVLAAAIGLVFIVGLSSDAFSRERPYITAYVDPDDHTWGGEGSGGSTGTHRPPEDSSTDGVSGFFPLDLIFNVIPLEWWWPTSTVTSVASPTSDDGLSTPENGANNLEASTNYKGN